MKVTVIGTGYVGLVTGVTLAEIGHDVICMDVDTNKINLLKKGISPIYENDMDKYLKNNKYRLSFTTNYEIACNNRDIIFIGVGTPENEDGSANLDYVKNVCENICNNIDQDTVVVVKSTVPVGTNDSIDEYFKKNCKNYKVYVVSNPEFLSQGTAIENVFNANRIIIGSEDLFAINKMKHLYKYFLEKGIPLLVMNRKSAEMVKYASNSFLALKISYINEISNLCEQLGADIDEVAIGMGYDDRIGNKFLKAGIGYGGSCFPKDTKALEFLAKRNGVDVNIISSVITTNEQQKLKMFNKLKKNFPDLKDKIITILGVTFKPNTDDLRDAPSLPNIDKLIKENAFVKVYDPVGLSNLKQIYKGKIQYFNNIEDAIKDSDAVLIMTEWDTIINFDVNKYLKLMKNAVIYDGRNCYDKKVMIDKGIEYHYIGEKDE